MLQQRSQVHRAAAGMLLGVYFLASTLSGLFHNHGIETCSAEPCAAPHAKASCSHGRHCHHAHSERPEQGATQGKSPAGEAPHDDCAVCKFLAQPPSLAVFSFESPSERCADEVRALQPKAVVCESHAPDSNRGPPISS